MATKMTYSQALEVAINGMTEGEARTRLIALKASIDKKNSVERKPTATQKENEVLKQVIMAYMPTCATPKLISDLIKEIPELNGMSPQKVGPLVRQLEAANLLEKVVEKRRTYYKVA